MSMLSAQELSALVQIGFAACAKGHIQKAQEIFLPLLEVKPDYTAAKCGLAFSHLVGDDFAVADAMLQDILDKEPDNAEVRALLAFSKALQKDSAAAAEEAAKVDSSNAAASELAKEAVALADRT